MEKQGQYDNALEVKVTTMVIRLMLLLICLAPACRPDTGDYDKIISLRDRIEANPNDSEALDRLIGYLSSKHWLDPANAAGCLRQLADGPRNKARIVPVIAGRVVPALVKQAEHVGREAPNALKEYGEYVLPYKADLILLIQKHPNEDIGWFAAEALGNLGPKAADALPAIRSIPTNDINEELVRDAINKINGKP